MDITDFRTALYGVPASDEWKPDRALLIIALQELLTELAAVNQGMVPYATKTIMDADVTQPVGTQGRVYNDPTPANNGVYVFKSGAWSLDTGFYAQLSIIMQPYVDDAEQAVIDAQTVYDTFVAYIDATYAGLSNSFDGPSPGFFSIRENEYFVDFVPHNVVFDPDGRPITFNDDGNMKRIPVSDQWFYGFDVISGPSVGWLYSNDANPADNITVDYQGVPLSYVSGDVVYYPIGDDWTGLEGATRSGVGYFIPTIVLDGAYEKQQPGLSADIPAFTIAKPSGDVSIVAQTVAFGALTTGTVADQISSLVYAPAPPRSPLQSRFYSGLVIRKVSDNSLLTLGVDYGVSLLGSVYGLVNTAAYSIKMSYTSINQRIDVIYTDAVTGAVGVAAGTARGIDPENYIPSVPAGKIALFNAYVTPNGIELIDVCNYRDGLKIDAGSVYQEYLTYCKKALRKTFARGYSGQTIRLIIYGDSISSMGGSTALSQQTIPNGIGKDSTSYFGNRWPADAISGYTKYTQAGDPDFTSYTAGSTDHIKLGYGWYLKQALEEMFDVTVEYRNWSVSGTHSENSVSNPGSGDDRYNGRYPTRLNAMLADSGHLLLLCFGMNEIGETFTYTNFVAIIEAFQATGGEVIALGCPTPSIDRPTNQSDLQYTNDAIMRAALDTGSAFVNPWLFEGPNNIGATGLSMELNCGDGYNHPAPPQLEQIGKALTRILY